MNDHQKQHFSASSTVRDTVLGMSDGLTVPFALAAGLTGAVAASHLVVVGGLAEVVAGTISMGLGGYLAARSDAEHYIRERRVEEQEVKERPELVIEELKRILAGYHISTEDSEPIVKSLQHKPDAWVDFMMSNELGLDETTHKQALQSAATIGGAYAVGGMVPLFPYFFISNARHGLVVSAIVTIIALLIFGYGKAKVGGNRPILSAIQTVVVGGVAAAAAFGLASLISR